MLITKVWKDQPGKYFCISTRDQFKKWKDHFFRRSEFGEIAEFIRENLDKDVYWCPHGFSKPRRIKENAEIPKMFYADLDAVDPRELGDLMPTIAWESSPARYCGIWLIDEFMTEDVNQALTNFVGADPGGWDLTQVLRVPGTRNYKYDSTPTVKVMWSDGEKFKFAAIEKMLPKKKKPLKEETGNVKAIYKKYEKKFTAFVRRELLNGKPVEGKRSEVIWKLSHSLLEAGCDSDEILELLRASPWNKFKDRRDGDKQLKREIDKALSQHLSVSTNEKKSYLEESKEREEDDDGDEEPEHKFLSVSMADVVEENINWLWEPYLAKGELTILEGDPGLGKSYLAQMICGHIVDGKLLPSRKPHRFKGKVAYFDLENSAGSVTKKRLIGNGFVNLKDYIVDEVAFSVDNEESLKQVHEAISNLKPSVVVFDTLNTYIGAADSHKAAEVTQMMKHFVEIARRHTCSVLVLRHLNKDSTKSAIYRGQGSIAFTGMARVVMTVGKHPLGAEDKDFEDVRVMTVTKINVCKPPMGLTFKIVDLPDNLKMTGRSKFEFGDWVDLSSDDLLTVRPSKTKGAITEAKVSEAVKFLEDFLDAGPMEVNKILRAGEAKGFSQRLLYKAKTELNLNEVKSGFAKKRQSHWAFGTRKKKTDLDKTDAA